MCPINRPLLPPILAVEPLPSFALSLESIGYVCDLFSAGRLWNGSIQWHMLVE